LPLLLLHSHHGDCLPLLLQQQPSRRLLAVAVLAIKVTTASDGICNRLGRRRRCRLDILCDMPNRLGRTERQEEGAAWSVQGVAWKERSEAEPLSLRAEMLTARFLQEENQQTASLTASTLLLILLHARFRQEENLSLRRQLAATQVDEWR
jgi:hypothetical protein